MNVRCFLWGILFITVSSCIESDRIMHYAQFEHTINLKSDRIQVPSVLLYPRSLVLCDSNLVVFNEKMDTMFQCFHLPDLTFQYGFGTQGQGPGDFFLPSISPVEHKKNGFVMLDGINLKHISVEKDKAIVQTSTLNYGFNCFNDLISISDSSYCCNGGFENEKEFRFLYPDGNHESWGEYPETEERFGSVLGRNQAYIKTTVAKPDKSCFVSFYQHIRRFRIYGKDGELKRDVILDILPGQERPEVDDYLRFIHPISVYATDSYIYTLNLDMTTEEIENRKTTPNIQVFDWEGKPLTQYKLDCFINTFVVAEVANKIYGAFVEDEDHIYVFNLPRL